LSHFYQLWFDRLVPALGAIAGDPEAYRYLPSSVKRFPAPAELAAALQRAGLGEIGYLITAGGIIAIHAGTVGAPTPTPTGPTPSGPTPSGPSPSGPSPRPGRRRRDGRPPADGSET
jgi:demethylmenaquinone methyltransferase/2-methoxy-6-polyprenyl-1,4-benzoquinol methylase